MCDNFKSKGFDNKFVPAKYLQRFLSLNSAADMLEMKLFPNIKEIGESMSMWNSVENKIMKWDSDINRNSEDINIVVVGDGVSPRTASLFNYMTKWTTYSIDPNMRDKNYSSVKRLNIISKKIEDIYLELENTTIIIMPHSHAPILKCWNNIKCEKKWLIKMECCTHDRLDLPGYFYKDKYAITPKNEIYIWSNYKQLNND